MATDLQTRLREAMEGVTPGPWEEINDSIWTADGMKVIVHAYATAKCPRAGDYYECGGPETKTTLRISQPDKAYIALCSPDNIGSLLDRLDVLSARIQELEGALRSAKSFVQEHYAPAIDAEYELMERIVAALGRNAG